VGFTAKGNRRRIGRPLVLLVVVLALLTLAAPAHAAFPGANGRIAFERPVLDTFDSDIWSMNPDGTDQVKLTTSGVNRNPAWSPDGTKIAFAKDYAIYTMSSDGKKRTNLNAPQSDQPSWSPDGTKIAFMSYRDGQDDIYVMNADGTGQSKLTNDTGVNFDPDWSPDGTKIAFGSYRDQPPSQPRKAQIYTIDPSGGNLTPLTSALDNVSFYYQLDWSPDATKIVFTNTIYDQGEPIGYDVVVMNADGSNQVDYTANSGGINPAWSPDGIQIVFNGSAPQGDGLITMPAATGAPKLLIPGTTRFDVAPDWQPLTTAGYEHPQSASQLSASIVPAFQPCATNGNPLNGEHAPPLGVHSCTPPKPGSSVAAVGPASQSSASFTVSPGDTNPHNGNQADIAITASLADIQTATGGDYDPNASGDDLTALTRLRFTDLRNCLGVGACIGTYDRAATVREVDFAVPIDCAATVLLTVGSTCAANTTANALIPGFIEEQRQTVVQTFRVRVNDSGPNGIRGDSDDSIFATQGVYIP
jgi:hypothetical protein